MFFRKEVFSFKSAFIKQKNNVCQHTIHFIDKMYWSINKELVIENQLTTY